MMETNKTELKIGDKVLVVEVGLLKYGATGIVKGFNGDDVAVEFPRVFKEGHDCDGLCSASKGRWYSRRTLQKVEEQETDLVKNLVKEIANLTKELKRLCD